ncbi:hypothetical protein Ahy_A06g029773 [Arachis hypogaea]|uniref:Uncharacterized protein n=1 Tax=Arachis hypogaea TaxID=3818 RepID=A0A445CU86_ARAHY|nr:hypothetical protein Ahy_A06g029773 [Arachis hypogaea]
MAAKTKQEALSQIQGAFIEQYKRINDYCHELLRTNPDATNLNHCNITEYPQTLPTQHRKSHNIPYQIICNLSAFHSGASSCNDSAGIRTKIPPTQQYIEQPQPKASYSTPSILPLILLSSSYFLQIQPLAKQLQVPDLPI